MAVLAGLLAAGLSGLSGVAWAIDPPGMQVGAQSGSTQAEPTQAEPTQAGSAQAEPTQTQATSVAEGAGAALSGPDPAVVVGAPSGPKLTGEELEQRTKEVAAGVRCPVCQGLSVEASPSEVARAMRAEVKTLVAMGYDAEQVSLYFEASYGEFVRLEPKAEGFSMWVWVLPPMFLVAGAALVWGTMRRPGVSGAGDAASGSLPSPVGGAGAGDAGAGAPVPSPDLQPWLDRVRRESRTE